jgi:membrane fusion protein (multidrug efflux system)
MKVATVMRIDPLRVELTVPALFVAEVATGRTVTLEVDAYPGETFTGQVRYVSPALNAESRALVVEAEVANQDGRLKPGFFATARIEQARTETALMVPGSAVRTVAGTPRVFVIGGGASDRRAEERVVATGQAVGDKIEITSGVAAGDEIVATGLERVVDGVRLTVPR